MERGRFYNIQIKKEIIYREVGWGPYIRHCPLLYIHTTNDDIGVVNLLTDRILPDLVIY